MASSGVLDWSGDSVIANASNTGSSGTTSGAATFTVRLSADASLTPQDFQQIWASQAAMFDRTLCTLNNCPTITGDVEAALLHANVRFVCRVYA